MRIIGHVLFYTEEDVKKIPEGKNLNDFFPKGKYSVVRKFEDYAYQKRYVVNNRTIIKKFLTLPGIKNREERRLEAKKSRRRGHKLDFHHKQIKKRRRKKGVG